MALTQRSPQARLLHYSDRGGQDTSKEYQALLSAWGIEVSMSRQGDCYDNALMESFFATSMGECTDRQPWATHAQARQAIFECLEVLYGPPNDHIWYNESHQHVIGSRMLVDGIIRSSV